MNLEKFRAAVNGSDVIFIVGTGLTAAATDGASTATWVGLIRDGAERAEKAGGADQKRWKSLVDQMILYGLEVGNATNLIQAASMVSAELKRIGAHEYKRWLEDSVGGLRVRQEGPLRALLSFPFPILTTNYDTLLEEVGRRQTAYWSDAGPFHQVLTRGTDAIGHLHGVWNRPDSVILSDSDYTRLLAHSSTNALERAMSALKSIIYVGFGAGLDDPNFSSLLDWHRTVLPETATTHFRLCRERDVAQIIRAHGNDNVVPVPYGSEYADLEAFLRRESPSRDRLAINDAGLARDVVQEARDELRESMSSESVLIEASAAGARKPELVVPPVLLPMPYAMYVRERIRQAEGAAMEPFDAAEEVKAHDLMIVVGDEGAGVSTAVKWLAVESSKYLGSAAPVYVNFTQCGGKKPLVAAVTREALSSGLVKDRRTALPSHVLAVDDFNLATRSIGTNVLDEFIESGAIVRILGCKQGSEEEVVARLRAAGQTPRVYFLGRMRSSDVRALADVVSPGNGGRIGSEVKKVLEVEGLHRTPLTVSMLIYLVHRGVSETGTQTSIIDSYVQLLLTIGDPHLARPELSESDLSAILAHLAGYMTWEERSSLPEAEAVGAIARVIEKFGWPAQATEVLSYLRARRILRVVNGSVEFARVAYFFIFAARRATVDKEFRDLIANDPFYYEPVVSRYAALARTDGDFLDHLIPVVAESMRETVEATTPYEVLPIVQIPDAVVSEEYGATVASGEGLGDVNGEEDSSEGELELPEYNGNVAFGLVRSDMSVAGRLYRSVRMVSVALRDLDQVENLATKQVLLVDVLELWGRYITALSADSTMVTFRESLRRHLNEVEADEERREDAFHYLVNGFPAASAVGAIDLSLVTPKLVPTFDRALAAGSLTTTEEKRTASLFFLLALKPTGWPSRVLQLLDGAGVTWVVSEFFHDQCFGEFVRGEQLDPILLAVCQNLEALGKAFSNDRARGAHLSRYEQKAKERRARHWAQQH